MLRVVKPGLETTIQDWPGRKGAFSSGFTHSGPVDHWSFRLANLLAGNAAGAPALECQFIGPTLRFETDGWFAVTGADMRPTLDGEPVAMWQTTPARAGQTLALGPARTGARAYLAFAGGIDAKPFLGSCSTHLTAKAGGLDGVALHKDMGIPIAAGAAPTMRQVKPAARPPFATDGRWEIEVVRGPNDDWIAPEGQARFLESDWRVSAKSNRVGIRLEGPEWRFADKATNKVAEHGSHPSNCIDIGYPVGGINLCGDTPIILLNDGLTLGGFICPYTVPSATFWKLGQTRPNETYRFKEVSVQAAQALRRHLNGVCTAESLE